MNHGRTLRAVQHDKFQKACSPVWTEYEVAEWVISDLLHYNGVPQRVLDVLPFNGMAERRRKDVHPAIV